MIWGYHYFRKHPYVLTCATFFSKNLINFCLTFPGCTNPCTYWPTTYCPHHRFNCCRCIKPGVDTVGHSFFKMLGATAGDEYCQESSEKGSWNGRGCFKLICGSKNLRVSKMKHDDMASLKSLAKRNDSNIRFFCSLCSPAFFCWHPVGTANFVYGVSYSLFVRWKGMGLWCFRLNSGHRFEKGMRIFSSAMLQTNKFQK